jgi:hypothetical protein
VIRRIPYIGSGHPMANTQSNLHMKLNSRGA